jgi:hypothetical protein
MRLQLLDVKVSKEMSQETTAFHTLVAIEGRVVGVAQNYGRGGSTFVTPTGGNDLYIAAHREAIDALSSKVRVITEQSFEGLSQIIDLLVGISQTARRVAALAKQFPGVPLVRDAGWRNAAALCNSAKAKPGFVPCTVADWKNPSIDLGAPDAVEQLKAIGFDFTLKEPEPVEPAAVAAAPTRPGEADLALMEESAEFLMGSEGEEDIRRGKAILAAVAFIRGIA